ncbi:MAG TPA: zinc ribbon domain-containing protein, partial [Polyangia bacterium]|nr:zinc ribbon domain-containing protein [Polyangia bacterium]
MKCGRCGTENPDEASFCLACGNRLAAAAPAPPPAGDVHASSVANLRAAVERMVAA